MRKLSAFIGLILGLATIIISIGATSLNPWLFLDPPSMLFVLGGTVAATLMSYSFSDVGHALVTLKQSFTRQKTGNIKIMTRYYADFLTTLKRGDIRDIENASKKIHNPYLQTAAQMLRDGATQDDIMRVLAWRLERVRTEDLSASDVFRTLANYAPAFGMMGTILGLVNMLDIMDGGDFAVVGANMALALLTTFYGLILANMFFKPCTSKIEQKLQEDIVMMNLAREAVLLLSAKGKTPAYARDILNLMIDTQIENTHAE